MFGNFFAPLAMKVAGGIIAALVLALGITAWRADTISGQRDAAIEARKAESLRHEVTKASLNALVVRMDDLVREGELRADRRDKALVDVKKQTDPLREQADKLERGEIDIRTVEGL